MADAARAELPHVGSAAATAREPVPVLPALRPALPGGGLRPGSLVGLDGPGAGSLGAALVAGASAAGGWCGVVGVPDFGVVAAADMGAAPERLLLVDEPGDRWPDVVAALAEAVELVLLRSPEAPSAAVVRRLSALARKHGSVLVLTGEFARAWPGTRLRLHMDEAAWEGLGDGHGVLCGRRARVTAEGRDAPGRGRQVLVWLPGPGGEVLPAVPEPEPRRPALEIVSGSSAPGDEPATSPGPRTPVTPLTAVNGDTAVPGRWPGSEPADPTSDVDTPSTLATPLRRGMGVAGPEPRGGGPGTAVFPHEADDATESAHGGAGVAGPGGPGGPDGWTTSAEIREEGA